MLAAMGGRNPEEIERSRTASACMRCKQPFTGPIYRWTWYNGYPGGGIEPQCFDCLSEWHQRDLNLWRRGVGSWRFQRGDCEACGREVITRDYRRRRFYYCSDACRKEIYRHSHRRPDSEPLPCDQCGDLFAPIRADARYCSSACRQKAYRARKA
jgi:hypothetical protein